MIAANNSVITIDGAAASGKTTLAKTLASRLKWKWFSTGVIYRGMAYIQTAENWQISELISFIREKKSWRVQLDSDMTRFFYKDEDVTSKLYTLNVDSQASLISEDSELRKSLLVFQRDIVKPLEQNQGLIAEGRDCGTVVFPQASLNIFLVADPNVRAGRGSKDLHMDKESVLNKKKERDERDYSRRASPLKKPEGSLEFDTTQTSLEEIVEKICEKTREIK